MEDTALKITAAEILFNRKWEVVFRTEECMVFVSEKRGWSLARLD